MSYWTLDRVAGALGDVAYGAIPRGGTALNDICTDTRTVKPGDVFVALAGERFDGHDFVVEAVQKGAAALVVSRAQVLRGVNVPAFVVPDTTVALGRMARAWRRAWGGTVIAVAGSNGKTSTKEMIAAALGARLAVHATKGNLNNHVGVPLTLLATPAWADVAVVEIGTNHPGEVGTLRAVAEPTVSVLTSIGEEHLEGLGSLAGVLAEECAVFDGVSLGIVPSGHPEVVPEARRRVDRLVVAGLDAGDVVPQAWGLGEDARGWCTWGAVTFAMPWVGIHNLRNAVLAVAVARACGVSDEDSAAGMASLPAPSMRSALQPVGSLLVYNDAYNANPASARAAIATFNAVSSERPRAMVLGSMLELGVHGPALHDEIARLAVASPAQLIVAIGEFVDAFKRIAPGGRVDARVVMHDDAERAWPELESRLPRNAFVLLKGSRGTRLERLVPLMQRWVGVEPVASALGH